MYSDVVCEQLVKRKIGVKEIALGAAIVTGGLFASFLAYSIGVYADPAVGLLGMMLFICGLFLTGYCVRFIFVEYEYTFVNGELTIDKIIAKSKRKHLVDVQMKSIEKMGKSDDEALTNLKVNTIRDYSLSRDHSHTIYIYYKDSRTDGNVVLFFTPTKKTLTAMKTYISPLVFREAFPDFKAEPKNSDKKAD